MPTTLTRVAKVYKTGSSDITGPPAGWVGSKLGVKDDLVVINTSGQVDQACAASATIATPAVNKLIALLNDGIPASGTAGVISSAAGTLVSIEKVDDDTLIELPVATSSGASLGTPAAIATPATTALTLVGLQFQISRNSLGTYYVNTNLTSNPHCEVDSLGTLYPVSDNFATVLVKILPGARLN